MKRAALFLFSVAMLLTGGAAAVRGQSALDGFDPNANGTVRAVVVQPDGKILLGGDFTTLSPNGGVSVARNHIARLNPDGTLDTAFDPNANNSVFSIALQADGKILAGGFFNGANSIGGQTRNFIARLDATTGLADSFDPNADLVVWSIALQADGKILAGGAFTNIGGATRNRIARLDATTGLADSFDPNANIVVLAIVVQADGRILVGGQFTSIGGQTRNFIARLDAMTGLADSFDPNGSFPVFAMAVQADGKILVGGEFQGANSMGGQTRNFIARLDATTGLADSFNPNANNFVRSIVVQADGKILAGGFFDSIGGQTRNRIARLDATTGLADSFSPNADNNVVSIAVQADGKILTGGDFATLTPNGGTAVTRTRIARLETDGRVDQTLNLGTVGSFVAATALQPDGKILIGGSFTSVLGVTRNNIARLNSDGTLDVAFNPNANDTVFAIAVQADGTILAGGFFNGANSIGGATRNRIARLDATTGLADSFDPNATDVVYAIALQADGKILVGGFFNGPNSIGGQPRNRIARLDPTTGLADSFNPTANNEIDSIAIQADGKVLVGGAFTNISGVTRNRIARIDPTTGLADPSFNPNAGSSVRSIAVQTDGKILAGGNFTTIGGQSRNFIARLDPATGLADSFNPAAGGAVFSIAVQADGKILAGGAFTTIGGQTRNRIARLSANAGLADSFNPNASAVVRSIAVQADGKILAGGEFGGGIGGQARSLFARLTNDTAALQNLTLTRTNITWTRGGASPQLSRVTFESSNDNVSYTLLGNGTAAGNNWTLTDLTLPTGQTFYVRARGYYRTGYQNGSEGLTESVRSALLTPSTLGNIATRLRVQTGDNVLIGGFIITGTQAKKIIVRAIGPSLSSFFSGVLEDPILELRNSAGDLLASNDNWRSDQEAEIIATTIPPSNDLESAIVATLPANSSAYSAIVRGVNNGTGIGVVEAYDLNRAVDSKLANISTRGLVETDPDVLIGGLIVLGQNELRVIVRAMGPSLSVPGPLGDPTLALHDGNGALIASNDNWRTDQEAEIIATGIQPTDDLESAMVRNLAPGNYTAIVRGVSETTGIAVVEVYGLD